MNHPITFHHYIAYFHTATSIESIGLVAQDIKTARRAAQLYKRFSDDLKNCRTEVKRERKNSRNS